MYARRVSSVDGGARSRRCCAAAICWKVCFYVLVGIVWGSGDIEFTDEEGGVTRGITVSAATAHTLLAPIALPVPCIWWTPLAYHVATYAFALDCRYIEIYIDIDEA